MYDKYDKSFFLHIHVWISKQPQSSENDMDEKFFSVPAYLTVSGQLHLEVMSGWDNTSRWLLVIISSVSEVVNYSTCMFRIQFLTCSCFSAGLFRKSTHLDQRFVQRTPKADVTWLSFTWWRLNCPSRSPSRMSLKYSFAVIHYFSNISVMSTKFIFLSAIWENLFLPSFAL